MDVGEACLVVADLFVAIFVIKKLKDKANQDAIDKAKNLFSAWSDSISIKKRCYTLSEYLTIERYRQTAYKYNAPTATYTGVTVGNVTTGGWTVDEAHYTLEGGQYTEKFNLCYIERKKDPNNKWKKVNHAITTVYLPEEDVEAAKKAGLGKWLDGSKLVLKNPVSSADEMMTKQIFEQYGQHHDVYKTSNLWAMQAAKYMLTYEEVKKVYDFLCEG